MRNDVLISILIPTFNRSQLLLQAIESCFKQTYKNIQVIVSDNASTDDTYDVVVKYMELHPGQIKYSKNDTNLGPIKNWKNAYQQAEGVYVTVLSDDDYFVNNNYLKDAADLLNENAQVSLVICNAFIGTKPPGVSLPMLDQRIVYGRDFLFNFWTGRYYVPVISNIFRRGALDELLFWTDSDCKYSDIELWLKLMIIGNVGIIQVPSVFYRFHGTNIVTSMNRDDFIVNSRFLYRVYLFYREVTKNRSYDLLFRLVSGYILFLEQNFEISIVRNIIWPILLHFFREGDVLSAFYVGVRYWMGKTNRRLAPN